GLTRRLSPKVAAYLALAGLGLLAALALGRPEPVVLAAPFALLAGLGLALARAPDVSVELELSRERVLEGEELQVVARLSSPHAERLELELLLPGGLEAEEATRSVRLVP